METATAEEILMRSAAFEPKTFDPEARTVEVVFSTGAEVQRYDMDGRYVERLQMDEKSVDLRELVGGPVLDSHDIFTVRSILGVVTEAFVDGKRGIAKIRFSERPDVQEIARDVETGVVRNVSVGYRVQKWDEEKRGDGMRIKTAVRWIPKEISFAPLGADAGAKVRGRIPADPEPEPLRWPGLKRSDFELSIPGPSEEDGPGAAA